MLTSTLRDSRVLGQSQRRYVSLETVRLGPVGRCPRTPVLTIALFDDSGSLTEPGGGDPVGNRYEEVKLAYSKLRACRCKKCLAAVLHFDTPLGDLAPGRLGDKRFQRQLAAALSRPAFAFGTSYIRRGLIAAERMADEHPEHQTRLIVLTDWELFDGANYIAQLQDFPGTVLAVGLGVHPPQTLATDTVTSVRIDPTDPPGSLAGEVFAQLVHGRPGSKLPRRDSL